MPGFVDEPVVVHGRGGLLLLVLRDVRPEDAPHNNKLSKLHQPLIKIHDVLVRGSSTDVMNGLVELTCVLSREQIRSVRRKGWRAE